MEATKTCARCNVTKSVNDFKKKSVSRDGYQSYCKVCCGEVTQLWNENNRNRANERYRNYYGNNPQRRISENIHNRLNRILKRSNYSVRTEQIIGLNKQTYLEWLSYNFESGMCFANYGELWLIDLVIQSNPMRYERIQAQGLYVRI